MFNFTTQTVFNSVVKTTESDVRNKTAPKGYNVITRTGTNGPELRIGNVRFNKDIVLDVQKKVHTPENLAKVEFDITKLIAAVTAKDGETQAGDYRVALYLGLSMNSQDSYYSNDFVYKGKPFYVEFNITATDTAATAAAKIKKVADKYILFMTQEKILDVTVDGTKVAFTGVNGYQQIKKASIQKFDPEAKPLGCCNTLGEYIDIIVGVPVTWTQNMTTGVVTTTKKTLVDGVLRDLDEDTEVAIEPGLEAFGDYDWMIHNLRLPTLANTYFWAVTKSEMPSAGGEYTQFIVRICVERDGIGGEVVGQRATSVTTHVLYVLDQGENVKTIENELKKVVEGETIKTDADTVLAEPFANVLTDGE